MSIIPGTISNPLEGRLAVLEKLVYQLQAKLDVVCNSHSGMSKTGQFDYSPNWALQKFTITDHPATNSDPVNY